MIDNRQAPRAGMMTHIVGTSLLLTGLVLAGCSPNAGGGAAGSRTRVYASDVAGGAKLCSVAKIDPAGGTTSNATIKVSNEGGWCGLPVHQDGPKPFGAGLLTARPAHGAVTIHTVGDDTRLDYTPDRGFTGSDGFAVKLIPSNATVNVAVTVTAP